jgi:hypothetical protein
MKTASPSVLAVLLCIMGTATAQSLQYGGIQEVGSLKRGKAYSIRWSGGSKDQKIDIGLQNRDGEDIQRWEGLENDGEHTLKFRAGIKPGKNYVLNITVAGSELEIISSSDIRIRRRIPLALTASVLVMVPVVAIIISSANGSHSEIPDVPVPD